MKEKQKKQKKTEKRGAKQEEQQLAPRQRSDPKERQDRKISGQEAEVTPFWKRRLYLQ